MELKVKDLLAMEPMKDAEVLGGHNYIHNVIEGVTIMEGPDIANWIKGGEVILTSLYSIRHFNEQELRDFIAELAEKRVSALLSRNIVKKFLIHCLKRAKNIDCRSSSFRWKFHLSMSCIQSWGSSSIDRLQNCNTSKRFMIDLRLSHLPIKALRKSFIHLKSSLAIQSRCLIGISAVSFRHILSFRNSKW